MSEDISVPPAQDQKGLAKGSLRMVDAIAISISVLSPGMAMQLNTGGVAAQAGGSTPLAMLIGGVAVLSLAFVVVGFSRRMAAAGYAYTYVARGLGRSWGYLAGWLYFFGFACFVPMTMAGVGWLISDLVGLDPGTWWFPFFLIGMALLLVLSIVRIAVTTKVQIFVGIGTVLVLVAFALVVSLKGGSQGQAPSAFTFGHTVNGGFNGVFYGLILGITSFIGFESSADFGEETAKPRRNVPIAVFSAAIFAILLYVFTTYAATVGYGTSALEKDPGTWVAHGLIPIATSFGGVVLGKLIEIGALLSAFIVCVACATSASRTLFAMGREGVLPSWFAKTNARFKTPVNATTTIAVLATAAAALVGFGFGNPKLYGSNAFTVYFFFATLGTLLVILVYGGLCVAGGVFFKKTSKRFNPLLHALIPLVGVVIFGAAWYGSVYPPPAGILRVTPYITGAWLLIGIIVLLWLRANRADAVSRIGSILGEEGGELVATLDEV